MTELGKHIKMNHSEDNCDKTLNITGDLGRHLQTTHSESSIGCSKFVIEESGWSSIAAESFNDAFLSPDDEASSCDSCLQSFRTKNNFNEHIL